MCLWSKTKRKLKKKKNKKKQTNILSIILFIENKEKMQWNNKQVNKTKIKKTLNVAATICY